MMAYLLDKCYRMSHAEEGRIFCLSPVLLDYCDYICFLDQAIFKAILFVSILAE